MSFFPFSNSFLCKIYYTYIAEKRNDSPSIDGYESFLLKPEELWKSSEKTIEVIELCFFFTETDIMPSESLLFSENRGVEVGESFKIDYPVSDRVLLLDWDFNCILMKEISSPKEIEILKQESEICDEILLLGMHGGQNFEPSERLVIHVHLNEYLDGSHRNLKLKLYENCEIEPDSKTTFDDMVNTCIQKSCTHNSVGSFSASGVFEDYIKFEIDSNDLLQILKLSAKSSESNFISILEEYEDEVKPVQAITDAIDAAQFCVVIEDENSGGCVAKFLLSSITSNNVYFDNAVQMLNSPKNRSHEKITDWSIMITRTAESIWDSLYIHADYKLTGLKSIIPERSVDKVSHDFRVSVALPKIHTDVATIDPYNNITILVENCDPDLSFDRNENKNFLHVLNPMRKPMSGDDHVIEFKWTSFDRLGLQRNFETKVSILIELEGSRPKKIGRSISIVRSLEGTSAQHIALVRLRNMVKMGFEDASGIQCCFSHFLETTFKMAFAFSTNEEQSMSSRIFLKNAVDDIASRFYKAIANIGESEIYDSIRNSELFSHRDFKKIENVKVIEESEVAEFIAEIFGSLPTDKLLQWANSMILDEDSLSLVKGNESIDDLLEKHVGNLRRVLGMDSTELAMQLSKHPELMQVFVTAAQLVRDEIDNPTIDSDKEYSAEGLKTPEIELAQMLNESSAREIEFQTQEILASMEEKSFFTAFSDKEGETSQVLTENVSASKL